MGHGLGYETTWRVCNSHGEQNWRGGHSRTTHAKGEGSAARSRAGQSPFGEEWGAFTTKWKDHGGVHTETWGKIHNMHVNNVIFPSLNNISYFMFWH